MRYLLDTHAALWLFEGSEKLSQIAQDIILDTDNEIYVNVVSVWEIIIHQKQQRLQELLKSDLAGAALFF